MAEQSRFSPDTFLASVQRQLKGLDAREQGEILEELRGHLEDSALSFAEGDVSREAVMERAAAEMGDPSEVGHKLREEHMAKSMPLKIGLLAALPLFAFMLYFELFPIAVYFLIPRGQNPGFLIGGAQISMLALVLAVNVWVWRRGNRFALAPLAGLVGARAIVEVNSRLIDLWRLTPMPDLLSPAFPAPNGMRLDTAQTTWLGVGSWVTLATFFLPLLVLLVRWERPHGSLVILGGLAVVTAFHWVDSPMSWLKLAAYLALCAGLAGLLVTPRRWQSMATWAVVAADCAILALGRWYFIVYEAPHTMNAQWRAANPPTFEVILGGMPYSVLVFAVALLLCSQLLATAMARRARPLLET
jgi:hypothetical protein